MRVDCLAVGLVPGRLSTTLKCSLRESGSRYVYVYHYVCSVIECCVEGVWQLCKVSSNSRPMYTV